MNSHPTWKESSVNLDDIPLECRRVAKVADVHSEVLKCLRGGFILLLLSFVGYFSGFYTHILVTAIELPGAFSTFGVSILIYSLIPFAFSWLGFPYFSISVISYVYGVYCAFMWKYAFSLLLLLVPLLGVDESSIQQGMLHDKIIILTILFLSIMPAVLWKMYRAIYGKHIVSRRQSNI